MLVLLLYTNLCWAVDYYISPNGNDANNGTSTATPWKSIAKLNQNLGNLTAGSKVFFERGGTYEGQINYGGGGTSTNPIVFDAYGTGNLPVISGSIPLATGWTLESGNIYKLIVPQGNVKQVFKNTTRLQNARFPDTGYLRMETGNSNTNFTDNQLASSLSAAGISLASNSLVGATYVTQSSQYTWEMKTVTSNNTAGNIVHNATSYNCEANQGYFLTNKKEFLSVQDEWYFDAATSTLYLYSTTNPNNTGIQAAVYDCGIGNYYNSWNMNNTKIQNLKFQNQNIAGIWSFGSGCINNVIQNCEFVGQLKDGILIMNNNYTIQNNIFKNIGGKGIACSQVNSSVITGNYVEDVGIYPGLGTGGDGDLIGIRMLNGTNNTVSLNITKNTGYAGITIYNSNTLTEKNIIENALVITADGGGLYSWSDTNYTVFNNIYRNNIIKNVVGYVGARANTTDKIVFGIYMDQNVKNSEISSNTVYNIDGGGILINGGGFNMNINNNVVYKTTSALEFSDLFGGASVYGNNVSANKLFVNAPTSIPMSVNSFDNNYAVFASSNNNYLFNPYSNKVMRYRWSAPQEFTIQQWRTATGFDMNSKVSFVNWTLPTDNSYLVVNATNAPQTTSLTSSVDLDNNPQSSVTLQPFTSQIFISTTTLATNDNLANKKARMYPNPAKDFVKIELPNGKYNYQIFSVDGRVVSTGKLIDNIISVRNLPKGNYIIKVVNIEDAQTETFKLIRE